MDGSSTAPTVSVLPLRLRNLVASAGVVLLSYAAYHISPANRHWLAQLYGTDAFSFSYSGAQFVLAGSLVYVGLLAFYYLLEPDPGLSKSVRFWRVAYEFARAPAPRIRQGLTREDRVAVLATLLKAFYAPLMAMALMNSCHSAVTSGVAIARSWTSIESLASLLATNGFVVAMQVIILIDVVIFTLGYLVELPALRNEIKSVDPTLVGWAAALICYTPFNLLAFRVLGWQTADFPQFENPTIHVVLNTAMLVLMAVYTWASVALGFKASNLTHRGIVTRGPYRFVRHPAYVCKNITWWIGCLPLAAEGFEQSWFAGLQVLASVAGWSLIYIFRAITEEEHLRSVDGDYAKYAQTVRYRFIPGVA